MRRRSVLKLMGAGFVAAHTPLWAQGDKYPSKPVKIMVGSTPGSATDLAARFASSILQEHYDEPFIVENKPGAGGVLCMITVSEAEPDGYTLQLGGLGHNVIPPVTRSGLPIDIPKTIIPIAQAAEFINILAVPKDHPADTLQEFIDYQKEQNQLSLYGSNGVGSSSHLTSELYALQTGQEVEHVPYTASSDALLGVANGDLDFIFMNLPPTLSLIQSGKLKALAVTSSYRSSQLPDVPTMKEQGMEEFDVTSWLGVYGPAGMPEELVNELSEILVKGFDSDTYKEKFLSGGFEPKARLANKFAEFNASELERWGEVAKQANIDIPYKD